LFRFDVPSSGKQPFTYFKNQPRTSTSILNPPNGLVELKNMEKIEVGSGEMPIDKKQPEFRLVQPEYDSREEKTVFKDIGAVWKNISQKTGKEFYTLKIGKLKLLMFENQRLE
jgi:hypothetical protein